MQTTNIFVKYLLVWNSVPSSGVDLSVVLDMQDDSMYYLNWYLLHFLGIVIIGIQVCQVWNP